MRFKFNSVKLLRTHFGWCPFFKKLFNQRLIVTPVIPADLHSIWLVFWLYKAYFLVSKIFKYLMTSGFDQSPNWFPIFSSLLNLIGFSEKIQSVSEYNQAGWFHKIMRIILILAWLVIQLALKTSLRIFGSVFFSSAQLKSSPFFSYKISFLVVLISLIFCKIL